MLHLRFYGSTRTVRFVDYRLHLHCACSVAPGVVHIHGSWVRRAPRPAQPLRHAVAVCRRALRGNGKCFIPPYSEMKMSKLRCLCGSDVEVIDVRIKVAHRRAGGDRRSRSVRGGKF